MLAAFANEIQTSNGRQFIAGSLTSPAKVALSTDAVMLRALSRRWLRKGLVIGCSAYLIASSWWSPNSKLVACLLSVVLLGTYRETFISRSSITWKLWLAFLPLWSWKCSLQGAQYVYSEWEEQGGMLEALMLGLWGLLFAPLIDWLAPWRAGVFKLWIKAEEGRKILVWRGRSERAFHSNHRLLQNVTQLPTPRDSKKLSS